MMEAEVTSDLLRYDKAVFCQGVLRPSCHNLSVTSMYVYGPIMRYMARLSPSSCSVRSAFIHLGLGQRRNRLQVVNVDCTRYFSDLLS